MSTPCDEIRLAFDPLFRCVETPSGSRIATHCLYPSFEMVRVFVAKVGDGFKIHDDGCAYREAWLHGRDKPLILNSLKREAERFNISVFDTALLAEVRSEEWLANAILTVANASSMAAHRAVEKIITAAESDLIDKIKDILLHNFGKNNVRTGVEIRGKSGGARHFDFALHSHDKEEIYINGVLPHKGSVSSKYVAFSDTDVKNDHKFAVFEKTLETADAALLQQVATVVPFHSLVRGANRIIAHVR